MVEGGCVVVGFTVVGLAVVVVGFSVVGFAVVGFSVVGFKVVGFAVVACIVGEAVDEESALQFTSSGRSQTFVSLRNNFPSGQDFAGRKTTPSQQR